MGLVAAVCPSCGAAIEIPEGSDRCFCSYCGAQILTEAAIAFAKVKVDGVVQTKVSDFLIESGVLREYHGEDVDVVIPNNVNQILRDCFQNSPISSVSIPGSVGIIESFSFAGCKLLSSVQLNDGIRAIGQHAFEGCTALREIKFPASIRNIGVDAFLNCSGLNRAIFEVPPVIRSDGKNPSGWSYLSSFSGTALPEIAQEIAMRKAIQARDWRTKGMCQYCGGGFTGIIKKKCYKCGRPKDY